jgi:hypothetical protein
MTSGYLPRTVGGGDLVAELASIATQPGPNTADITDSGREQLRAIGFTV